MSSEEHRIIQQMIKSSIETERARISAAISNISMEWQSNYGGTSEPDFSRFIDDVAAAIRGE
jgi:hypothetical protein